MQCRNVSQMNWEGGLDAFFRNMDESCNQTQRVTAPNQETATMRRPNAPIQGLRCPLHDHVRLERQMAPDGEEFVECSEAGCPISLPWNKKLPFVISKVRGKMDPSENFFCYCNEVSKVGVIAFDNADSRDRGRCYLSCTQPIKCEFIRWID